MITPLQITLARTLLRLQQNEAAAMIGISPPTLSKIENSESDPPVSRIRQIQNFYESRGVEFLPGEGVRKTEASVYEGKEGFALFRRDILTEAEKGDADICQSNIDERLFDKWGKGEVNNHYRGTMAKLREKYPELRHRTLSKEGDIHFSAGKHSEYRWIPESEFGDFPFYIMGNKTAMILFEDNHLTIIILNNPKITAFYRKQFEKMWEKAIIPPVNPKDNVPPEAFAPEDDE